MTMVKSEGKSAFLKEYFVDHPDSSRAAINEAWQEAGNDGSISASLITKVRSDLGLSGQGRGRGKGKAKAKPARDAGSLRGPRSSRATGSRGAAPQAGTRRAGRENGALGEEGAEHAPRGRAARRGPSHALLALEGQIDEMLHQVKLEGGMPEFEEALRKARRILARSHGE